jgi:F-type H+-transporting ATPase subunit b
MELVKPGIGLIIWMTIAFAIVFFMLAKFAWPIIIKGLKDRENAIDEALKTAEKAREEMKQLQFNNELLLSQAKDERDALMRDARVVRDSIIEEAKGKASSEAERIIEAAKQTIEFEKLAAITELKNQIAILSIDIARKVLDDDLKDSDRQHKLIEKELDNMKLN